MRFLISLFFILSCLTLSFGLEIVNGRITNVNTIDQLDSVSVFHFAIISDNDGDSPINNNAFKHMDHWLKDRNAQFVIGLGNHVKKGKDNTFLTLVHTDNYWHTHFFPGAAEGENEYYGNDPADWSTSGHFLDEVELSKRDNISIHPRNAEYYAKIKVKDYTIHLIQFGNPPIDSISFKEDSRQCLLDTLQTIDKGPKDIIIVGAHSINGFWTQYLSDDQKDCLLSKADLILSSSTRLFSRSIDEIYCDNGALQINTGSIAYPAAYCPCGYIEVHVLEKPFALVVQYINASIEKRELQNSDYAFIKFVNGPTVTTQFRPRLPEEEIHQPIVSIKNDLSSGKLDSLLTNYANKSLKTDISLLKSSKGFLVNQVDIAHCWEVFPHNNDVYILTLTSKQYQDMMNENPPFNKKAKILMAEPSATAIIHKLQLAKSNYKKANLKEIDLLIKTLKSANL